MTSSQRTPIFSVAALFVATALASCNGAANDARPPVDSLPDAPLKVVNAAGRAGVCRDIAAKLGVRAAAEIENYRNGEGSVDYSLPETTILCDAKYRPQAERVRGELGLGRVVEAAGLEAVEVVVGWDAPEPDFDEPPADGVVISKSENAVYFFEGGKITHIWPCAVGKPETPTPVGRFEVTVTLEKPTWYWKGKAIPPGPDNGLGGWFIGINKKGYGIHGTNEPPSIGTAASHGCVRLYNEDADALVKMVSPGTPVVIVE